MTATAKPSLYVLAAEYAAIQDEIEANDGELTPEIEAALDAITLALPERIEARQFMYRRFAAEAEANAARARAYHEQYVAPYERKAKVAAHTAERIKAGTQTALELAGLKAGDKIATEFGGARLQRNSAPKVTVAVDPKTLPAELQRVTVEADLDAIKACAKHGAPLPEGVMVEVGQHLRWL